MSSLVVESLKNFLTNGRSIFPFTLHQLPIDGVPVTSNQGTASFTSGAKISAANQIHVYRGTLLLEGSSIDVVVKFDFHNSRHMDLVKEAKYYENQAKKLQGTVVPTFFGIYHATVNERVITCLVLEDCGSPMETWLHDASVEFCFQVAKLLMQLHDAGIQHNDISEVNIVIKDNKPRLIDLSHATPHKCDRTEDIEPGKLRPDALKFACTELHDFASEHGIWEATDIFYYGAVIPKQFVTSAEDLLAMTPPYLIRTPKGRDRILREASELLKQVGITESTLSG
ncbi:hypothetical protein BD410DRAFT_901996 [Rickenella mellea]|uniref:Fungal-type protein kinase domain-containing protein n=1 Tax=Rickenella mellea TaxID=50990 RepID=A0A4Y7PPP5_9AGAM|nr:hypothetical protein BD410DRAFT_901996 [Rickenella mellea]